MEEKVAREGVELPNSDCQQGWKSGLRISRIRNKDGEIKEQRGLS